MKLSVFVVTYNQEQYIRQCLDSIVSQKTSFEYEVVIGEDCSTDATPQICDEYASRYPFIRVHHHSENMGFIKNWKFVLGHCSGDYVAICEGDDYWIDDNKLQKQVDFLDSHFEYGMCCSYAKIWDEELKTYVRRGGTPLCQSLNTILLDCNDVMTVTSMMRRNLFMQAYDEIEQFIPEKFHYDSAIWYWFAANSKIYFFDEELGAYRVLPNSGCHTTDINKMVKNELVLNEIKFRYIASYITPPREKIFSSEQKELLDNYMESVRKICNLAEYVGEMKVRNSKAYKIGKRITDTFGWIKNLLKQFNSPKP